VRRKAAPEAVFGQWPSEDEAEAGTQHAQKKRARKMAGDDSVQESNRPPSPAEARLLRP